MKSISTDQQSPTQPHAVQPRPADSIRSLLWSGVILGIGTIGSLDEILLHQLLQWHTFYVHTTLYWRIVIDGVFHLVSAGLLLDSGLRLAWQRPQFGHPMQLRALIAGMLLGMGGFNLYDGMIQHKLLQLHPVREGVPNLLLYDLTSNALALAQLLLGWWLWRSLRTEEQRNSV